MATINTSLTGLITDKISFRFWPKVSLTANDELCWNWNGWIRSVKKSYGRFSIGNIVVSAHRVAYYLFYRVDPKELQVLHHCDNPNCVNPKHLFLGTNSDNIADKVSKGRQARNEGWSKGKLSPKIQGSLNPSAKLDEIKVLSIRGEHNNGGVTIQSLATKYDVSKKLILNIVHKKSWRHI